MLKKLVLLCIAIALSIPLAYGLHEQIQLLFDQYLQAGNFREARELIVEQAFPNEQGNFLKQIDQAEKTFKELAESQQISKVAQKTEIEDLIAQARYQEAIALLIQKGYTEDEAAGIVATMMRDEPQTGPLPEAAHAGPATPPGHVTWTSPRPTPSVTPSPTGYPQLTSEQFGHIREALAKKDNDTALAIIMSAGLEYEEAVDLLEKITVDFYAAQPRRSSPASPQASSGKEPDVREFMKDIETALSKGNIAQAEQFLKHLVEMSERHEALVRYVTDARYLIAQAKDAVKQAAEHLAKKETERLAAQKAAEEAHKNALKDEVIKYGPLLKQAQELLKDRKIDLAKQLYQQIAARTLHDGEVWHTTQMMLKRLAEPVTVQPVAPLPEPAPRPAPAAEPEATMPIFQTWAEKMARANDLAASRSLTEQAQAKKLYTDIIKNAPDDELKKKARIALRKIA